MNSFLPFELVRDSSHRLWLFNMKGVLAKASTELTNPAEVEEEAFLQQVLTSAGIFFGTEMPHVLRAVHLPREEPGSLLNANGVEAPCPHPSSSPDCCRLEVWG